MFEVKDRVFDTSLTAGVGTLTLVGAQVGHQAVSALTVNAYTSYFLEDGTNWEIGIGQYLAAPNRLTRETILASSNAGAAVNWSGATTINVRIGLPAAGVVPRRRLAKAVGGGAGTTVLTQDEQRRDVLEFTGVLTGDRVIEVDATVWTWPEVYNNTTGAFNLTLRVTGQTGVKIPQKRSMLLHCNGTDVIRPGDAAAVEGRAANTMLGALDHGKTIAATGTFTQTLDAAATLGNAWSVQYRNDGTGIITLDPNAAELIDGSATINLYTGESCVINSDGAAFKTVGRGTGPVLIQRQSVAGVASVDFTVGIDSTFDEYFVEVASLVAVTDNTNLWCRVSQDAGASWKAAGYHYAGNQIPDAGGIGLQQSASANQIVMASSVSNSANGATGGRVALKQPSSAVFKILNYDFGTWYQTGGSLYRFSGSGAYLSDTGAINGLRFLMSSGNITSGIFSLYGVRKS